MKKVLIAVGTLGLIAALTLPAFASEGFIGNGGGFRWGEENVTPMEQAAEITGEDYEDMRERREQGETCHDIFEDTGVDLDEMRESRHQEMLDRIDEAVALGEITEEEANQFKEHIEERSNMMDGNGPHHGPKGGMRMNRQERQGR
ncbi:hypothetical protein PRVXT_002151 [Proteinivorax tanatarense]|uniref:Uncharacterized protein n=1 Tax=Proteinivorax tanatarense TaxID=1260629 RepID=A0AAU7VJW5_9FIRM